MKRCEKGLAVPSSFALPHTAHTPSLSLANHDDDHDNRSGT